MKTLAFTLCSAIVLSACQAELRRNKRLGEFPVTQAIIIDTTYNSDYVAEIHARQNIEIRARVKGYLEKIHVDEGERVREGQVLFTISSQEYREDVLKAQAMLKSAIADAQAAEVDMQNVKLLTEKNVVSKTEITLAKAKLEAANARIEEMRSYEASARLRLSYTEVRAPFNGVLDRLPSKRGSLVDEGTLLTTLSDNDEVYAYFNVSEKEYLSYAKSESSHSNEKNVILILADNSTHPYLGHVETIEGEFNQGTGSIAFRARFANPQHILRHGASGKVRLKRHLRRALVIPQKATFEIQDKMYVFVLDRENRVKMRNIVPRLRLPQIYVIASGLTPSDRIIYEGIQDLSDGITVETKPVDMRRLLPQLSSL